MTATPAAPALFEIDPAKRRFTFISCFVALVATSFAFVIWNFVIGSLGSKFLLTEVQKGEILGAGLWPFGLSIVLFSLVVDKIGYGKSMIFAFLCHAGSVALVFFANGYDMLYFAACLCGLAAGTVEAVVNPAVATMYPKNKTKMLGILHAGWPGGIVLGGLILLVMADAAWQTKMTVLLIPTVLYGILMMICRFPVNERVAAGVSYRDMLKEPGALGALIVLFMIAKEIGRLVLAMAGPAHPWMGQMVFEIRGMAFNQMDCIIYGAVAVLTLVWLVYTRSLGRWMYIFLLLVMILLAITELGTDRWIKELRDPAMKNLGLDGGWILVYTASIMMLLRFCIGPIVKVLKPLGVLLISSLLAAAGLFLLSDASVALWILVTATIYGAGQAFFWPVTLGVIAERFPKGGALTLNAIAGVGMLGVGIIGAPLLGYLQENSIQRSLADNQAVYQQYRSEKEELSVLGKYTALDGAKVKTLQYSIDLYDLSKGQAASMPATAAEEYPAPFAKEARTAYDDLIAGRSGDAEKMPFPEVVEALKTKGVLLDAATAQKSKQTFTALDNARNIGKQDAMAQVAVLPLIMAVCYLLLIIYFRATGGYKAIELTAAGERIEYEPTAKEFVADEEARPDE